MSSDRVLRSEASTGTDNGSRSIPVSESTSKSASNQSVAPRLSRTTSSKLIDTSAIQPRDPHVQKRRIPSPTKLPQGTIQRSQSVKQLVSGPSLKNTPGHQRRSSQSKTPTLKKASTPKDLAVTAGKRRQDSHSIGLGASSRQISPVRNLPRLQRNAASEVEGRSASVAPVSERVSLKYVPLSGEKGIGALSSAATKLQRPTFSTNQNSFSPQKSIIKEEKGSPHKPGRLPICYSREAFESTLELLHLHLVHSRSAKTQNEWKASARAKNSRKYEDLSNLNTMLVESEKELLEQKNAAALIAWGSQPGGSNLENMLQILSKTISDIWTLSEADGKYTSAIQAFEHWYEICRDLQRDRSNDAGAARSHIDVIEGLGDGWKAEVKLLQVILLEAANDVLSLGDAPAESDIARTMAILSEMLQNMLEELDAVQYVEQTMMLQEQFWVQSSIDHITSDLREST